MVLYRHLPHNPRKSWTLTDTPEHSKNNKEWTKKPEKPWRKSPHCPVFITTFPSPSVAGCDSYRPRFQARKIKVCPGNQRGSCGSLRGRNSGKQTHSFPVSSRLTPERTRGTWLGRECPLCSAASSLCAFNEWDVSSKLDIRCYVNSS